MDDIDGEVKNNNELNGVLAGCVGIVCNPRERREEKAHLVC